MNKKLDEEIQNPAYPNNPQNEFEPASEYVAKPKMVLLRLDANHELMVDALKPFVQFKTKKGTQARTKAILYAIEKAYEIYKDAKP